MAGDEVLGLDRRRVLLTVGASVLLLAGAVGLVGRFADFGEMLDALRRAEREWFAACVGGQLLAYAGYVLAYRDVARAGGGPELPYTTVTRVVLAGFGATALGSAPGGLAVDFWALRQAGARVHEAARRVLAFNTLEWAVMGWYAAAAAGVALAGRGETVPLLQALAWILIAPLATALGLVLATDERTRRLSRGGGSLVGKARKVLADALGGVGLVRYVAARPHRYPAGVAGFPVFWAGQLLTIYGALRAFGAGHVPVAALILAFVTGYVVTALPLPAGGSGSIEASLAGSLTLAGVPLARALLAVLAYRFFTFWLPLLPALAVLPALAGLRGDLRSAPREGRRATS